MSADKVFITARWENLLIVTYKVPYEVLQPHLPPGLELDTIDGHAFASVVAFDFNDTKVKGIRVPFNVDFPEINLRFYVKNKTKRGVVFIKEFVPKLFIPFVANNLYNENYMYAPMESSIIRGDVLKLDHKLYQDNKSYSLRAEAENKPFTPAHDTTEHFFKEHEWGFGRTKKSETMVYRVEHPVWEIYPVLDFSHTFDFSEIYGAEWKTLNGQKPYNITFAKGSEIKVFEGEILQDK